MGEQGAGAGARTGKEQGQRRGAGHTPFGQLAGAALAGTSAGRSWLQRYVPSPFASSTRPSDVTIAPA